MSTEDQQDGNAAIDEIAKEPNLDFFYINNPETFTDEQLLELIQGERTKRALFIEAKQEKKK